MEPLMDMRVSRVGPVVEGNLVELVDLVKQMGRKGDLTESQNRRMVGYMGNLDEMRSQIVIMIQRYEDDSKVLKRLLDLVDRIDDVKLLAITAETSQGPPDKASLESDKEIAKQYDTPFNPLLVSTINILDVSGLFASNVKEEDLVAEEEEEEAGDEYWDHEDDPSELGEEDDAPKDVSSINLSMSNLHLPNLFGGEYNNGNGNISLSTSSLHVPTVEPVNSSKLSSSTSLVPSSSVYSPLMTSVSFVHDEPSSSSSSAPPPPPPPVDRKGKGKAKAKAPASKGGRTELLDQIRARRVEFTDTGSESDSERSSGTESEEEASNGAGSSRRITIGSSKWRRTYPAGSSASRTIRQSDSSETDSDYQTRPPRPPPMPVSRKQKKGVCEPTLCKICYDEYTNWDKLYELRPCGHIYCRECWQDHLTTNINDGAVLDLECAFPGCECEVLPGDIRTLCTPETFAKFERFTVLAALRADPNARWCPNPYCNNGIKHNPATMPWVFCNACNLEFCFHCMAERHEGAACGEEALAYLKKKHDSEQAAMDAFKEFTANMKALVKPCPGCNNFIEKNDGCNHMTCGNPSCRTQFCWLCLNLYNGDHFSDEINFPDCYEKQYWTPPNQFPSIYVAAPHAPRTRRFANIAKKVGMYVGVGVAVVTLGVPAAVIGGPVYGCFQLHKRLKAHRRNNRLRSGTINYHGDGDYHPPSPARVAEAAREARRLYELEHS